MKKQFDIFGTAKIPFGYTCSNCVNFSKCLATSNGMIEGCSTDCVCYGLKGLKGLKFKPLTCTDSFIAKSKDDFVIAANLKLMTNTASELLKSTDVKQLVNSKDKKDKVTVQKYNDELLRMIKLADIIMSNNSPIDIFKFLTLTKSGAINKSKNTVLSICKYMDISYYGSAHAVQLYIEPISATSATLIFADKQLNLATTIPLLQDLDHPIYSVPKALDSKCQIPGHVYETIKGQAYIYIEHYKMYGVSSEGKRMLFETKHIYLKASSKMIGAFSNEEIDFCSFVQTFYNKKPLELQSFLASVKPRVFVKDDGLAINQIPAVIDVKFGQLVKAK